MNRSGFTQGDEYAVTTAYFLVGVDDIREYEINLAVPPVVGDHLHIDTDDLERIGLSHDEWVVVGRAHRVAPAYEAGRYTMQPATFEIALRSKLDIETEGDRRARMRNRR